MMMIRTTTTRTTTTLGEISRRLLPASDAFVSLDSSQPQACQPSKTDCSNLNMAFRLQLPLDPCKVHILKKGKAVLFSFCFTREGSLWRRTVETCKTVLAAGQKWLAAVQSAAVLLLMNGKWHEPECQLFWKSCYICRLSRALGSPCHWKFKSCRALEHT